jgi:hypothetical protein
MRLTETPPSRSVRLTPSLALSTSNPRPPSTSPAITLTPAKETNHQLEFRTLSYPETPASRTEKERTRTQGCQLVSRRTRAGYISSLGRYEGRHSSSRQPPLATKHPSTRRRRTRTLGDGCTRPTGVVVLPSLSHWLDEREKRHYDRV